MKKKFFALSTALMMVGVSCFSFFADASTGGNKVEEEMRKSMSPALHEECTEETVDVDLLKFKISDIIANYNVDSLLIDKVTDRIFGEARFISKVVLGAEGRENIILECRPVGSSQDGEQAFRFSVKAGCFEKSQEGSCLLYNYDRHRCIPKCTLYGQYSDIVNEKALSKIYSDIARLTGIVKNCFDPAINWSMILGSAISNVEDRVIEDRNMLSELSAEAGCAQLLKQHIQKRAFDCWLLHQLHHAVVMVEGNVRNNANMYSGFGTQTRYFANMLYYYVCHEINKSL